MSCFFLNSHVIFRGAFFGFGYAVAIAGPHGRRSFSTLSSGVSWKNHKYSVQYWTAFFHFFQENQQLDRFGPINDISK